MASRQRDGRFCLAVTYAFVLSLMGVASASCTAPYDRPSTETAEITVPVDLRLGRSSPVTDPYYTGLGNSDIDILHYGLDLAWDPSDQTLGGVAVITLRATTDALNDITLDFSANLNATDVTVDGSPAAFNHVADDLVIRVPRPPGDVPLRVDVHYEGAPGSIDGPLTREFNQLGLISYPDGRAYAIQEPFGAFTWFPANDHPSDEALYDARFTVPDGWSAVTSGTFLEHQDAGAWDVFYWRSTEPIATYAIALAFEEYDRVDADGPGGVEMTYWVPKAFEQSLIDELSRVPEHIVWLEERIGAYPFDSGGVVVVDIPVGMETQEMITLAPQAIRPDVLVHELAHQWYGNAVTPRTWLDVWLNEGFATYLQVLWQSEHGELALEDELGSWTASDQQYRDAHGPPGRFKPDHALAPNVYQPPALLLHEIRQRLGDDDFFAMLRAWAADHRHTTQDRASFTHWLNQHTGQDFTGLIAAWLDSPTTPSTSH